VPEETGPERRHPGAEPVVLGIDEAGRGSVLGPLVVGGFLCPISTIERLPALGVRDSKLLSPARREEVYQSLADVGQRVSIALDPATIDRAVRRGGLNLLEAQAFARLVKRHRPDRVELDACDVNAPRFGRTVARLAGFKGALESRHRADRELPVVGAASIVAKVRRDSALARLQLSHSAALGSGYPSDRRTVAYLEGALRPNAPAPPWVRESWATTARVKGHLSERTLESFGP
jgi:ribonuclease HII